MTNFLLLVKKIEQTPATRLQLEILAKFSHYLLNILEGIKNVSLTPVEKRELICNEGKILKTYLDKVSNPRTLMFEVEEKSPPRPPVSLCEINFNSDVEIISKYWNKDPFSGFSQEELKKMRSKFILGIQKTVLLISQKLNTFRKENLDFISSFFNRTFEIVLLY